MSAGTTLTGDIMLATGERLNVKNADELLIAVQDQRQTWVEVIPTDGPPIKMRATAIIGFTIAAKIRRAKRTTKAPADTPHTPTSHTQG